MVEVEARTFLNYSSGVQTRDGTENGDQLASQGIREEGKTSEQQQKKTNAHYSAPFFSVIELAAVSPLRNRQVAPRRPPITSRTTFPSFSPISLWKRWLRPRSTPECCRPAKRRGLYQENLFPSRLGILRKSY